MHQALKHEEFAKIYRTNNHSMFKIDSRNRPVDERHVAKIMKKIQKENLLDSRPITVTNDLVVVDGQHRLEAARNLNLPIYYQIANLRIEDAPTINSAQQNWDSEDYLKSYSEMGDENYTRLLELSRETNVSPNGLMKLIACTKCGGQFYKKFKDGLFTIEPETIYEVKKILLLIQSIIQNLKQHPAYSEHAKILSRTRGMDSLFSFLKNVLPEKHHQLFARKVYDYAARIYRCSSIKEYHDMYMAIYKYHNSKSLI